MHCARIFLQIVGDSRCIRNEAAPNTYQHTDECQNVSSNENESNKIGLLWCHRNIETRFIEVEGESSWISLATFEGQFDYNINAFCILLSNFGLL